MTLTVSGLYVYPIKSCGGVAVPHVSHSLRGFLHDREWAIVDTRSGKVLTQRDEPRLCLVSASVADGELRFSAPGADGMRVDIEEAATHASRRREAEVWGARVPVIDQGMWPSGWFSAFLRRHCFLARMDTSHARSSKALSTSRMAFADGHEILAISEASLADLNARMEAPLPMDRFRPNIVISGCAPYEEDDWVAILASSVRLVGADRCVRCVITTTDQRSAARGKEPLATLAGYRKTTKGVVFGRYFNAVNGGCIGVGDPVGLLTTPW